MRIPSSDGVVVVVHELSPTPSPQQPPLLLSHATGFHGRVWEPVAGLLADRFGSVALDYRGHGDTIAPPEWAVDWSGYGDDVTAVARAVWRPGGLIGVGHSMGGAGLLMAALRQADLFRAIVVYEPIVIPPEGMRPASTENPLAAGARRRRATFDSFEAAISNYAAKPPLNAFTPAALDAYVRGGFRAEDDGSVHLKCTPEHEARTFEASANPELWDRLGEITVPVWVVSGRPHAGEPSMMAPGIAERLPNAQYVEEDDLDHFGPMTHPERIADLVRAVADRTGAD